MASPMKTTRALALISLLAIAAVTAAPAAVATNGSVSSLSARQSVKTELSPEGEVRTSRLYTQILAQGDGTVELAVPTSTRGLRNLEGFTKPAISADSAVWNLTLPKGEAVSRRTVADYDRELPVSIETAYTLDGEEIAPADLVGRSGLVTVTYTVRNRTAKPTEIEVRDGHGRRQTETVDVVIPLAGSFTTTLDERFTALDAPTAVQAGDGRGNTMLNWSLLLFEPIGSNTATMSWSAHVTDATVPAATAQVVPVVADGSPIASGIETYGDAVDQTVALSRGSTEIDRNTVRVAAGATQLLEGLTKLADGSRSLADGLEGAASGAGDLSEGMSKANSGGRDLASGLGDLASGAGRLSAGLGEARSGGTRLSAGLGDLASGAGRLSAGLGDAEAGGTRLSSGLGDLASGAGQLSGGLSAARVGGDDLASGLGELAGGAGALSEGLETATAGGQRIAAGAAGAQVGAAKAADSAAQIAAGARALEAGLNDLADAADKLPALAAGIESFRTQALGALGAAIGTQGSTFTPPGGGSSPSARSIVASLAAGLPGAHAGAAGVAGALKTAAAEARDGGASLQALAQGQIQTVQYAMGELGCGTDTPHAACPALASLLNGATPPSLYVTQGAGVSMSEKEASLLHAAGILDQVANGLATTKSDGSPGAQGAVAGLEQILAGLHHSVASSEGSAQQGLDRLAAGVESTRAGVRENAARSAGAIAGFQEDLAGGLNTLAGDEGLGALATGAGDLAGGLGELGAGGEKLATGAAAAAAGSTKLAGGLGELDAGGQQLAGGAATAAAGSKDLVGGLNKLADGGRDLQAGATKASSGSKDLVGGLNKLADGGRDLQAGATRASAGASKLSSGLGELDAGADRLADGLGDAADGSLQIADGLQMAKLGGTNLASGAEQLSQRGTSTLAAEVNESSLEQARKVATLQAASDRAKSEGLPYPAPEGAAATAVYQIELASVGGETGASTTRLTLAALLLGAMGVGAFATRKTAQVIAG